MRRDVRGGRAAGERREERVERALGGREAVEVLAEARALHDWVPRKGGDEGDGWVCKREAQAGRVSDHGEAGARAEGRVGGGGDGMVGVVSVCMVPAATGRVTTASLFWG